MPAPLVTAILALGFLSATENVYAIGVGVVAVIIQLVVNNSLLDNDE